LAMLKDTETLRSDPIDESAPNVVPPMPPVTAVAPSMVGTPLLDERFVQTLPMEMTKVACEAAGNEGALLLKGFFAYHKQPEVGVRRLVLAPSLQGSREPRKRKASDARRARTEQHQATVGASFGCLLGNITAYLEGRGLPGERAYVLRSIRTLLLPAAEALRYMRGTDVPHLARGMASCRVVHAERASIRETANSNFPKIDFKYGNSYTAVGATATLLVVFGVMSTVPDHSAHFWKEGSLWKAMRCAEEALASWHPATTSLPTEHWEALAAECRAMHRACIAAYVTWKRLRDTATGATEGMQLLLQAAQKAAFPSGAIVNEFTQADLCARIQNAQEIWHAPTATAPPPMVVLPLSEIPDSMALVTGGGPSKRHLGKQEDERSCASSSWKTLSSNQSRFSHVSQDSLSGLGAVGDLEL
jgi:hypothetical protein